MRTFNTYNSKKWNGWRNGLTGSNSIVILDVI